MLEPATVALLYTPSHCLQAHKLDEKVPIDANQCTSSSADSLHSVVAGPVISVIDLSGPVSVPGPVGDG